LRRAPGSHAVRHWPRRGGLRAGRGARARARRAGRRRRPRAGQRRRGWGQAVGVGAMRDPADHERADAVKAAAPAPVPSAAEGRRARRRAPCRRELGERGVDLREAVVVAATVPCE
jgi:hypothetical protein